MDPLKGKSEKNSMCQACKTRVFSSSPDQIDDVAHHIERWDGFRSRGPGLVGVSRKLGEPKKFLRDQKCRSSGSRRGSDKITVAAASRAWDTSRQGLNKLQHGFTRSEFEKISDSQEQKLIFLSSLTKIGYKETLLDCIQALENLWLFLSTVLSPSAANFSS